ncbi:MAG TPA: NAD(P)/FAD-dependent oxidoreductase [Xanthobacteraceae bacterium]|nr:NAD(P)/FAD-dependent oxidoreductase [Xanthobacteraceae bacterium]
MTDPRVVIVGAGFGGLSAAKALAGEPFDVTVIDRHNYHLFQPLLYQVATASLSPAEIASPIRGILQRAQNVNVMLGKVSGIDLEQREVLAEGRRVPYDTLVLATGAQHAYFGHGDWAAFAPGLKTIDDATYIRRRILLAFEKAETETDPAERARLLNFVIVGGGPTGVEMAGAIAELAKRALAEDFRSIDPRAARIILVEAAPRLLTPFDPPLSEAARISLEQLGVEVRLGTPVTALDAAGVSVGTERIEARTVIWGAGVIASPAGEWLGAETDRAGRVKVAPDLSVPGHPDIFVIGDTAAIDDANGNPLPGVAPVAKQQGNYVAALLIARQKGKTVAPFRYRDLGSLATIGRKRAVIQMGRFRMKGFFAWLLWCVAHIYYLIGFRNRFVVAISWLWNYITFQRATRLITGMSGASMEALPMPQEEKEAIRRAS